MARNKNKGTTNQHLKKLIRALKELSRKENVKIWKAVAKNLEKSNRIRRKVNLYKINKYTKNNDTVVIPGKVLGIGDLNHKVLIAAFQFSKSAEEKSKGISIEELMKKNPKGKGIKVMG